MTEDKDVFICGVCKASFKCNSFSRFMEHKMLHIDANKRIHCSLCLKSFPKRNALQIHLERVHAIPQKRKISENDSSSTALTLSSARCKPCTSVNSSETEQCLLDCNEKLDSSFPLTANQLKVSSFDVSLLQSQRQQDDCQMNGIILNGTESCENSNLSVDVLTSDNPPIEFPLNALNYYEDVCCNRLLVSDAMNGEIEGNFVHPNPNNFPSSLSGSKDNESEITNAKPSIQSDFSTLSLSSKKENDKKLTNAFMEEGKSQMVSEVNDQGKKVKEIEEKGEKLNAKMEKESVDFHFLLGTTSILGNSMTYERVEFKCMHCVFSSAWRPSLVKHMKITHKDILAFHDILDIQTSKSSNIKNELSKKYKIMKLSEHSQLALDSKSRKVKRLARSVEYQDIPGKYTCPVCNKVFSRIRYIRRHQLTHKTQRSYLCDHCGKPFKTRSSLVVHSRSHSVKSYHCPQCDFVSSLTGAIHRHRQIHPSGSAVCEICGAVYTDKSTLKKHMRVHDPSRPFPCLESNCTWRFNSETLMKGHMKSHTVEGKFQCTHCGYRFRHKHHLQRHIARIHPQDSLVDSSANVSLTTSSNTLDFGPSSFPHSSISIPLSSDLPDVPQRQELDLNCNSLQNNQVIHSDSGISLESGYQIQTAPCNPTIAAEDKTDSQQTDQQNIIQVLVNNNGQDIIISLPSDINPDLINNGNINLDYSDIIPHLNSSQTFFIRDSQQ